MNENAESDVAPNLVWVVIPAYNEQQVIGTVIDDLASYGYRVVVVDDASTDATYQIVKERKWVDLLHHPVNLGQGAALQTGIQYALMQNAQFIVSFDADGQHQASQIAQMVVPLCTSDYDVVLGSRFLTPSAKAAIPFFRRMLLIIATHYTRLALGIDITDTHNGFRAMSSDAAAKIKLTQNNMAHASEFLEQIVNHHLRYTEVAVNIQYTNYSRAKGQKGLNALNIMWEIITRALKKR